MSTPQENDAKRLLQEQFLSDVLRDVPPTELLTVYANDDSDSRRRGVYCALVPTASVPKCLEETAWDFSIGHGMPGAVKNYKDGEPQVRYLRFGDDDGIEPLVLHRSFHQVREAYLEISEEFRTFHNLYHDAKNNRFFKFDDAGGEHLVAIIEDNAVKIRCLEIRQYMAIREMHLALYFDAVEYSQFGFQELGYTEVNESKREALFAYDFYGSDDKITLSSKTFTRLVGKRFIPPVSKAKSGFWGYAEDSDSECASFVIGIDGDGAEVTHTSTPDELSNNFGANPGRPHYLTPVFFRKTVLDKYYQQPGRFSVDAGTLRCGGLWILQIDNHQDDAVVVWLGDLGRDLPHSEQLHWRSHNIPPNGKVSDIFYRQQVLGEWVETEHPEHLFKHEYDRLAEESGNKLGWRILLPLSKEDEHYFLSLRIPSTNEQKDFDDVVLALTKVLIDSLNESSLNKLIPAAELASVKAGISRLEKACQHKQVQDYAPHIKFLRDLQDLRSSGSAHKKGSNYRKIAEKLGVQADTLRDVFRTFLLSGLNYVRFLQTVIPLFATPPKPENAGTPTTAVPEEKR